MDTNWLVLDDHRRISIPGDPIEGILLCLKVENPITGMVWLNVGGRAGERLYGLVAECEKGADISLEARALIQASLDSFRLGLAVLNIADQLFARMCYVEARAALEGVIQVSVDSMENLIRAKTKLDIGRFDLGEIVSSQDDWADRGLIVVKDLGKNCQYQIDLQWDSQWSRFYLDERVYEVFFSWATRLISRIAFVIVLVLAHQEVSVAIQQLRQVRELLKVVVANGMYASAGFIQDMGKLEGLLQGSDLQESDLE